MKTFDSAGKDLLDKPKLNSNKGAIFMYRSTNVQCL